MAKKPKDWQWYEERDARIRQMHDAGIGSHDIGKSFGISAKAVQVVLKKLRDQEQARQRSAELLKDFRSADDLDKGWKVDVMLDALNLATRARIAIGYWCEWKTVSEMTLRQVIDLVLPDQSHPKGGYLITHMLSLRNVRIQTFWLTVKRLTESDLGMRCNLEWRRRLERLIQASRIVGDGPYSWSIPIEHPDWLVRAAS
jgi:hypothetical protein